jgi:hypothetical protein
MITAAGTGGCALRHYNHLNLSPPLRDNPVYQVEPPQIALIKATGPPHQMTAFAPFPSFAGADRGSFCTDAHTQSSRICPFCGEDADGVESDGCKGTDFPTFSPAFCSTVVGVGID